VIEGQVTALNFYPVKGARGIAIETARVNTTGLAIESVADREWMLVDRNRVFVSQREVPRLALVKPSVNDDALVLDAPGAPQFRLPLAMPAQPAQQVRVWSAEVRGFDMGDQVATWLTSFLERNVRLVRFDRSHPRRCNPDYVGDSGAHTMFADGYPLLVIGHRARRARAVDDTRELSSGRSTGRRDFRHERNRASPWDVATRGDISRRI